MAEEVDAEVTIVTRSVLRPTTGQTSALKLPRSAAAPVLRSRTASSDCEPFRIVA